MNSPRPISELRDTGLLWLINRVVFHPRGYALALHADDSGGITGWSLQGDGSEAWSFPEEREQELFSLAESTLRRPTPERAPDPSVLPAAPTSGSTALRDELAHVLLAWHKTLPVCEHTQLIQYPEGADMVLGHLRSTLDGLADSADRWFAAAADKDSEIEALRAGHAEQAEWLPEILNVVYGMAMREHEDIPMRPGQLGRPAPLVAAHAEEALRRVPGDVMETARIARGEGR